MTIKSLLRSSLIGAFITLALIIVPLVHFLTVWFASFLGGFVAGSRIYADQATSIKIGAIMSLVLVVPIIGIIYIANTIFSIKAGFSLIFVVSLLLTLYVGGLGILGASLGGSIARKTKN
tara:strand:+ start:784 stop:1143 length:360 start_codon:yes stop_codon:yes gene_type:complete